MQENFNDSIIETALVTDVNVKKWTVDVMTQHSHKPLFGIPWMEPYLHKETGEGIHYVPEPGTLCLICTPSDGMDNPFILGFLPIPRKGEYRSNRIQMNPGDIALNGRDGNFVILRRGGIVQVGATPLCQRLNIPINHLIRDVCLNYNLYTGAGELVWEVDRNRKSGGKTPVRYWLKVKESAEDTQSSRPYAAISLILGSPLADTHEDKRDGAQNLKESGLSSPAAPIIELDMTIPDTGSFNFVVDRTGNLFVKTTASVGWDVAKDWKMNVAGNRTVTITGTDTVKAERRVEEFTYHEADYEQSTERANSGKVIESKSVQLGLGPNYRGVLTADVQFWTLLASAMTASPAGVITINPVIVANLQTYVSNTVKVGDRSI